MYKFIEYNVKKPNEQVSYQHNLGGDKKQMKKLGIVVTDKMVLDRQLLVRDECIIVYRNEKNRLIDYIESNYNQKVNLEIEAFENKAIDDIDLQSVEDNSCNNGFVCYIGNNSEDMKNSIYYAFKMRKRVVQCKSINEFRQCLDVLSEQESSCVFIIDPLYREQIQTTLSTDEMDIVFGNFIYQTSEDLLFVLNKNIIYQYLIDLQKVDILSVNRVDYSGDEIVISDESAYIPRKLATKKNVKQNTYQKNVFSLIGHARDELIWLSDSLICTGVQKGSFQDDKCTSCQIDGKCFKQNLDVLKIKDLLFQHVFINACCCGKMTEAVFGDSFNVTYQFVQNHAVTYIGTPFLAACCPALNSYYNAMCYMGFSFGEICKRLNQVYHIYKFGASRSFLLYGDPDLQALPVKKEIPYYEVSFVENREKIHVSHEVGMIEIHIGNISFGDIQSYKYGIVMKSQKGKELYGVITDCSNGIFIRVSTIGKLNIGDYYIEKIDLPAFRVYDIKNFHYLIGMGFWDSRLKNYFYESLNSVQNYIVNAQTSMLQLDTIYSKNYGKRIKIYKRLKKLCENYTSYFQENIAKKGFAFDAACLEAGFVFERRETLQETCPYCNGRIYKSIIKNDLYTLKRENVLCTKCGVIYDVPYDAKVEMSFSKEEVVQKDLLHNVISVNITNHSEKVLYGYLAVAIASGVGKFSFVPAQREIELAQESNAWYEFEIINELEISSHNYWLMGVAVLNGNAYFIKKDIFYQ